MSRVWDQPPRLAPWESCEKSCEFPFWPLFARLRLIRAQINLVFCGQKGFFAAERFASGQCTQQCFFHINHSAAAILTFYISFSFKQVILFRIKFCSTTTKKKLLKRSIRNHSFIKSMKPNENGPIWNKKKYLLLFSTVEFS